MAKPRARSAATAAAQAPIQAPAQPPVTSIADWGQQLLKTMAGNLPAEDFLLLQGQVDALTQTTTAPVAKPSDTTQLTIVNDADSLATLASALAGATVVAVDLETAGLDPRLGEIVGVGLAVPDATFYVPIAHRIQGSGELRPGQLALTDVLDALRLQDKKLIAHNAKFELKLLRHHGKISCQFIWDTMIAARLLRSDLSADLEKVAVRELDVPDWSLSAADMKRMQFLPIETVATYCGKDCRHALELYRRQLTCLV
jgi:DNA polymerase I-like protein with 3'-5' exonuclease and polymerase domains